MTAIGPPDPASRRRTIGRRLREARLDAGLRLVDVAEAARVSPQCLARSTSGPSVVDRAGLGAVTLLAA